MGKSSLKKKKTFKDGEKYKFISLRGTLIKYNSMNWNVKLLRLITEGLYYFKSYNKYTNGWNPWNSKHVFCYSKRK